MHAAYTHSSSNTPEEDAKKRIIEWARSKGLMKKKIDARLFGRNTYPTDKPEPHGYILPGKAASMGGRLAGPKVFPFPLGAPLV